MAITNQERVGKAMELLRAGLTPFVEREFNNLHQAQAADAARRYLGDDRTVAKKPLGFRPDARRCRDSRGEILNARDIVVRSKQEANELFEIESTIGSPFEAPIVEIEGVHAPKRQGG